MGEKGMESQAPSPVSTAVPNEVLTRAPSAANAAATASGSALGGGLAQTGGGAPPRNAIEEAMSRTTEPPKP